MATLYVTEFAAISSDLAGNLTPTIPLTPPLVEQEVTIQSSSTQSTPFGTNTRFIMVCGDTDCFLAFGADPTSSGTTSGHYLPAKVTRFYAVIPGQELAVHA